MGLPRYLTGWSNYMSQRRIPPLWLWTGVLGGAAAFALDRIASTVLVIHSCRGGREASGLFGLTASQTVALFITILTSQIAVAAGLISWRIWRATSDPAEETTAGTIRNTPFWALGGMFLSAIFLAFIVVTGGLALAVSTSCPPA
ncbi:MAG TPA: hypothetical protein VF221_21105 [Chloroflexota bacterium]